MFIGPIKNLILLGASPLFSDFSKCAEQLGCKTIVITSPDQLSEIPEDLNKVITIEDIASKQSEALIKSNLSSGKTLAISFGARWIIKEEVSENLFGGPCLNAHGARLPSDRGGGGFTWRALRGDRIGNLMLHQIDNGVDSGPVIASKEYIIPPNVRTPGQHQEDYENRLRDFVCNFIKQVISNECSFPEQYQPHYNSSYYPRVHTPTNGWIDWSWSAHEIEKFILAFDDPYPGARTHWKNGVATLRKCQLHVGEIGHHPFQRGIVIRNNRQWLTIALNHEYSLLCESIQDLDGNNLLPKVREGDRFFNEAEQLDTALSTRVQYKSTGLVPPQKKAS